MLKVYRCSQSNVKMSGGLEILKLTEGDITKMLSANTHLGAENTNFQMEQYIYKRRPDGNQYILLFSKCERR